MPIERIDRITCSIDSPDKDAFSYVELLDILGRAFSTNGSKLLHNKFRVNIYIHTGKLTSIAEIQIWASNTWKTIHKLANNELEVFEKIKKIRVISTEPVDLEEAFLDDRNELIRIAGRVCYESN